MEYFISLGTLFCIYSLLSLSLNMIVGMSGLLSLAQAAFYGIGAYAAAIGMTRFGLPFSGCLALGALLNMAVALFVGKILARFKGDYYVIVSAGLSIIVFAVMLNWKELTNGPLGILGIAKPWLFETPERFLLLCALCTAAAYGLYRMIDRSAFGRCLKALREDEGLAEAMGYKTRHFKSIIFTLSAVLSGGAGALFASYISFIDPSTFQLKEGIFLFTIIIVGGLSSARGSLAGAAILLGLPEALRFVGLPYDVAAQVQQMIYGAMLVLMMALRPQGLLGKYRM